MRRYQDEISVVKLSNMEMILEIERKNLASQLAGGLASLAHDQFRYAATIMAAAPVSSTIYDVFLVAGVAPAQPPGQGSGSGATSDYTVWTCWAWWYVVGYDNPTYSPCDNMYVQNDPIATAIHGHLARLVSRHATSAISRQDALSPAVNTTVSAATVGCQGWGYPEPDLFLPQPWDQNTEGSPYAPRAKCISETVPSGGGGGGGGC